MEFNLVLKLMGLCCITILFVESEPMVLLKRFIGFKEEFYEEYNKVKQFIFRLISCVMCSGFWIGLAFTQDVFLASIISIVSELINDRIKNGKV